MAGRCCGVLVLSFTLTAACASPLALPQKRIEVNAVPPAAIPHLEVLHPSLSAAAGFACAVTTSGDVSCWGRNDFHQLGDGTTVTRSIPTVNRAGKAAWVRAAQYRSCSAGEHGEVTCWGNSQDPIRVPALEPAMDIAPTQEGACSINQSHEVLCVVIDDSGEKAEPIREIAVAATKDVVSLAAARNHICLVRRAGDLECLPTSALKVTNAGASPTDSGVTTRPIVVAKALEGIAGVRHLVGVRDKFCATFSDGRVACWSDPYDDEAKKPELIAIKGVSQATQVAIGTSHGCALERNGKVKCWGLNAKVALGTEEYPDDDTTAVPTHLDHADQIAVGDDFSCAAEGRHVLCWGSAERGALGNGAMLETVVPRQVDGITGASQVVAADGYSCALTQSGVWCWGVGRDAATSRAIASQPPVYVKSLDGAKRLSMNGKTLCAIGNQGFIGCVADPTQDDGQLSRIPKFLQGAKWVARYASDMGIAVLKTGKVAFFGAPLESARLQPSVVEAKGITNPVDIAGAGGLMCAVLQSGNVDCASLKAAVFERGRVVADVERLSGIQDAEKITCNSNGFEFSCAFVTKTGRIVSFEVGGFGQPLQSDPSLQGVSEVSLGNQFKCALLKSHRVMCSGYNEQGQLGSGDLELSLMDGSEADLTRPLSTLVHRWSPVRGITDAISIASGDHHTCVATKDGRVLCWGGNDSQQVEPGVAALTAKGVRVQGLELR